MADSEPLKPKPTPIMFFPPADAFLVAKALGAMGVRLPEWWTPGSERTREEIVDTYVAFALKLVG